MNNAEGVYQFLFSPSLYPTPSDHSQGMWCLENRRHHLGSFGTLLGQPLFMKRANRHGYFLRLGKTIFSAHLTTAVATSTASLYSVSLIAGPIPGYLVKTAKR